MKKVLIKIYPHSIVDIITNSSTELFCEVTSEYFINEIKEILEDVFKRKVDVDDYSCSNSEENREKPCIHFTMDYGDNEYIQNDFVNLLTAFLNKTIGEENYKINTDVCY